ncbi:hypothetical protein THRCLA_01720 [Thraustotheca clavata]|uniref:RCC1-like domain-containing protein n=1 Tax=Thraustotheca clavata TaxID=74557 RepID=A0A1W0A7F7_9STRA|nr:hypothetical protein THRCLA_01720 [Thraustotheca clavata]
MVHVCPSPGRVDARWAKVAIEQVMDDEFLTKQYRRSGFASQYNQYNRHEIPRLMTKNEDDDAEMLEDEEIALGEAVMAVGEQRPVALARFTIQRLRHTLIRSCEYVDPFRTKVELQKYLLRCIYQGMTHRHGKGCEDSKMVGCEGVLKRAVSYEAELGVNMFLSLVSTLAEPEMSDVRSQFLVDIVPLIQKLPPLALAPINLPTISSPKSKSQTPLPNSPEAARIMDQLQTFLIESCTESNSSSESATLAMKALLQLALARGSISTFLLAIHVLLRTDTSYNINEAATKKIKLLSDNIIDDDTPIDVKSLHRKLPKFDIGARETTEIVMTAQLKKKTPKTTSPVHPLVLPQTNPSPKKTLVKEKSNTNTIQLNAANSSVKLPVELLDDTPTDKVMTKAPHKPRFNELMIESIIAVLSTSKHQDVPNYGAESSIDDEEDCEVWSCGQNSYGELSHGDTNPRKSFERIEALQGKGIVQVCAGNEHTVALSSDGVVFTCGYNDNGQCGQGITTRIPVMTEVSKLDATFLHSVNQIHAYNGCEHTVIVGGDGAVASFGYNYRGQLGLGSTSSESVPRLIRGFESKRVRLVSCSYYHTILSCTGSGNTEEVYAFGRNDYGQLGLNDTLDRRIPTSVDGLNNLHIASLACGQYHSIVATSVGGLIAFGKNDYGQLGIESMEHQLVPTPVKSGLERFVCTEVRCGYYHTIVSCAGGHIYGFGRNDYGQLGIGDSNSQQRISTPQLIFDLEEKEIVRISCGCYHTIAVADNGMLYVFGRNNHGQLGTGDTVERLTPTPVDIFVGKRVAMVAAGFYHTVVLTGGKDSKECHSDASGGIHDLSEAQRNYTYSPEAVLADPGFSKAAKIVISQIKLSNDSADPSFDIDPEDEELEGRITPRHDPKPRGNIQDAVRLLAHLDNLSKPFVPKRQTYPALLSPKKKSHKKPSEFDGRFQAYCIDLSNQTFGAIASILEYCSEHALDCSTSAVASTQTQIYFILAILRILQANLSQALQSGVAKRIQRNLDESKDMQEQLRRIQFSLVRLIDIPKWLKECDGVPLLIDGRNQLIAEAVETILIGFELFYPCQCAQINVIFSILKDSTPMVQLTCRCNSSFNLHPYPKNRKVVLEPLLRRLTDDAILSQFIPQDGIDAALENIDNIICILLEKIDSTTVDLLVKADSSELRHIEAHFRPYVALINAIHKCIAGWAENTAQWIRSTPSHILSGIYILGDESRKEMPPSWNCYMHFCVSIFEHCIAHLKSVMAKEVSNKGNCGIREDIIEVLEFSLVGQVLPPLCTSLLLISDRSLFSVALSPLISELVCQVDMLNQRVCKVRESERQYVEALWYYQLPLPPSTATLDIIHALHWLYSLEKLLVHVGTAFATTLVEGNTVFYDPSMNPTHWIANSLFEHGFEPQVFANLAANSRAINHSPLLPSASIPSAVPFTLPLPFTEECSHLEYLVQMQDTLTFEPSRAFCSWIRTAYANEDANYRFLLKASHALDERIENAFFAVLLKQHDLSIVTTLWASRYNLKSKPPHVFLSNWSIVADLTRGYSQEKNSMLNQSDSKSSVKSLSQRLLTAAQFLFTLSSPESEIIMPYDPILSSTAMIRISSMKYNCTTRYLNLPFLAAFPKSKWKKVRILVHSITRWKNWRQNYPLGKETLKFMLASELDLRQVQYNLLDQCRRASYRGRGIETFSLLLSQISFTSIRSDVCRRIGDCFRISLKGKLLYGLESVGQYYEGFVRSAASELWRILTTTLNSDTLTHEVELFENTPLILSVLNCWTIVIDPSQYELVSHLRLVPTLYQLGKHLSMSRKNIKSDSREMIKMVKRSQVAVWTALQYVFSTFAVREMHQGTLAVPVAPLLYPCFSALLLEAEASVAKMIPSFQVDSDLLVFPDTTSLEERLQKRSYDIIVAPQKFV